MQWLERELELLHPQAAVALGATAARALAGRGVSVMRDRGHWVKRPDGLRVLITLRPSALLRGPPEERSLAFERWLKDLRHATRYVAE